VYVYVVIIYDMYYTNSSNYIQRDRDRHREREREREIYSKILRRYTALNFFTKKNVYVRYFDTSQVYVLDIFIETRRSRSFSHIMLLIHCSVS